MKRLLSLILCFMMCFGLLQVDKLSAYAADFVYDMTYFMFSDVGVTGDRHPEYAGDEDPQSAWTSVEPQKAGMKFIMDMMTIREVGKITFYQPEGGYPGKYNIYTTKYKENWGEPFMSNVDGTNTSSIVIDFPTEIDMRFVMIELVEGTEVNPNPWQISNVEVLSIADASKELPETVVDSNKGQATDDSKLATQIKILNDLDIPVTGTEETVPKATFLEWLLKFSDQYRNIIYGGYTSQSFTDIPKTSPHFNMVEYSKMTGIINGGDVFGPSNFTTKEEALEMSVNVLGYGIYIQNAVDGSVTYESQISRLGLAKGIDRTTTELTGTDVVTLFFNLMEAPLLELAIEDGNFSILDAQDKGAGYVWQGIYKVRGIVTANSSTNIMGGTTLDVGQVKVDNTTYDAGETNVEDLLGHNIEMYVKEGESLKDAVVLAAYKYKDVFVEIPAPNVGSADNNAIWYFERYNAAREVKAPLATNFSMVYNGVAMIPTDISKVDNMRNGTVTIIDNDADGKYDVVLVNEYIDYYISYINQVDNIIYDKYTNPMLSLGLKNDTLKTVKYYKNGERVEFSAIKNGMILSVVADKTTTDTYGNVVVDTERAQVYTVYISDKTVSGTISMLDDSEGSIEIEGRKYKISDSFNNQVAAGAVAAPLLGNNVTAYLDYYGEVAAFEVHAADGFEYGYITKVFYDPDVEMVGIRMFMQSNTSGVRYLAERVTIDGTRYRADSTFDYEALFYNGDELDGQLISYKCNMDGYITNIDTKRYDAALETKDTMKYTPQDRYDFNTWRGMLFPVEGSSNPNLIAGSMILFIVPETVAYRDNNDYYRITDRNYLVHDNAYDIEIYKKSDFGELQVGVIYRDIGGGTGGGGSGSGTLVMVDEVVHALDENGDPKYMLTGTDGRSDVKMYFKDENVLLNAGLLENGIATLHRGDVVNLRDTSGSEILEISREYDVQNLNISLSRDAKRYYSANFNITGQVYDATSSWLLLTSRYVANDPNAEASAEVFPFTGGVVYDQAEDVVRKATSDDIRAYKKTKDAGNTSIVIINADWGEVRRTIIFNLEDFVPTVS